MLVIVCGSLSMQSGYEPLGITLSILRKFVPLSPNIKFMFLKTFGVDFLWDFSSAALA